MKIKYINQANTVINNINSIINWNDYEFYDDLRAFDTFHLKLNHVSREPTKYASYFNYVQPYEKQVSSLPKNIFLYAFGLYPNLLQPSGGLNTSMIDEIEIDINLSEKTHKLLLDNQITIEFKSFARIYNVLRIMSGMAGLAFYGD